MDTTVTYSPQVASAVKTVNRQIAGLEEFTDALRETELGEAFEKSVALFAGIKGRVIVTGIGKSGHVARKIAATFCSTGTSAFYLHPGEASHGDLGAISRDDAIFAITWSGDTSELSDVINYSRINKLPLVVATAQRDSMAGRAADICLALPKVNEACPNELAPTSSTTLQMVLGDSLAVALIEQQGFTRRHFHLFHPGGRLGAQLATVGDIMATGDALPRVPSDATLQLATIEMSRKRYGCTAVVDEHDRLVGAFTDGDLRRCITSQDLSQGIADHMSRFPVTAKPDTACIEALSHMNKNAVSVLFVIEDEKLVGIVHIHDIVKLGIG